MHPTNFALIYSFASRRITRRQQAPLSLYPYQTRLCGVYDYLLSSVTICGFLLQAPDLSQVISPVAPVYLKSLEVNTETSCSQRSDALILTSLTSAFFIALYIAMNASYPSAANWSGSSLYSALYALTKLFTLSSALFTSKGVIYLIVFFTDESI